jgi:excisionase family DNA binding protein
MADTLGTPYKVDTEFQLLLTPEEVAAILRLSVRTITGGICRKTLPWIKVGGSLRMRREALLDHFKGTNNERFLEKKSEILGVRVSMEARHVLRRQLSNKERSHTRRRSTPTSIEEWEVKPHLSPLSAASSRLP